VIPFNLQSYIDPKIVANVLKFLKENGLIKQVSGSNIVKTAFNVLIAGAKANGFKSFEDESPDETTNDIAAINFLKANGLSTRQYTDMPKRVLEESIPEEKLQKIMSNFSTYNQGRDQLSQDNITVLEVCPKIPTNELNDSLTTKTVTEKKAKKQK